MATLAIATGNDESRAESRSRERVSRWWSATFPRRVRDRCGIKVQACGVCHSDGSRCEGAWPGIQYPRVPGHEVAGVIDAVGADVFRVEEGAARRGGLARRPGQTTCPECRRGDFRNCRNLKIAGISYDGGYQDTWWLPSRRWRLIPDGLKDAGSSAAAVRRHYDLQCARHSALFGRPGCSQGNRRAWVTLGVQFANKFWV